MTDKEMKEMDRRGALVELSIELSSVIGYCLELVNMTLTIGEMRDIRNCLKECHRELENIKSDINVIF